MHVANVFMFLNFCNKGTPWWSEEPKHVAYFCITLKCCVWPHTSFVFQQCQKVAKTVNIWSNISKSETVLRTFRWETLYFYRKLTCVFSLSYLSKLPAMYETVLYYKNVLISIQMNIIITLPTKLSWLNQNVWTLKYVLHQWTQE